MKNIRGHNSITIGIINIKHYLVIQKYLDINYSSYFTIVLDLLNETVSMLHISARMSVASLTN